MMKYEVLHVRDSDGDCTQQVFIDGEAVDMTQVDFIDVDPGRGYTREEWEQCKEYFFSGDMSPAFRAAAQEAYANVSEHYIDDTGMVHVALEITNIYVEDGEEIVTHEERWMPEPPDVAYDAMDEDDQAELDAWADEYILPLTGTGRTEGDASYFAKVTNIEGDNVRSGHPLIGCEFEWGV